MACATMLARSTETEVSVRDIFAVLQLFAAVFLSILGLAMAFRTNDSGSMTVGAFLGAIGITFLALLFVNVRRPR